MEEIHEKKTKILQDLVLKRKMHFSWKMKINKMNNKHNCKASVLCTNNDINVYTIKITDIFNKHNVLCKVMNVCITTTNYINAVSIF